MNNVPKGGTIGKERSNDGKKIGRRGATNGEKWAKKAVKMWIKLVGTAKSCALYSSPLPTMDADL